MPWRLASVEEQKAYERERIEEAKRKIPLDRAVEPIIDLSNSSKQYGADMAGQVLDTTKYKYDRIKIRCPDGKARYSASSADAIAKSMFGMTKDDMMKVAIDHQLGGMLKHFDTRNLGHLRMILGQALRSQITKGTPVTIRGVTITKLDQKVNWPEGYTQEDKGTIQKPVRRQASAHRIDG